jgi:hypothetical protein
MTDCRFAQSCIVAFIAAVALHGCGSGGSGGNATTTTTTTIVVPTFPLAWKANTNGNLTQPGFYAGDVEVNFAVDCTEGPAKQKMITVYPDKYTVITRCDKGYQYIIQPASRGLSCGFMDLKPASCTQCGCPFCMQTTAGKWGDKFQWKHVGDAITSKFTGDNTRVWRAMYVSGKGPQKYSIEFATSSDDKPISMVVNASEWISSVTWFKDFNETVLPTDFDPPKDAKCPAPPTFDKEHSSLTWPDRSWATADAESSSMPAVPQTFPSKFKASMLVNISQPGYDGGNVFVNFTQDCSNGPAAQISLTIFGNFHAVHLNCSSGLVHTWDHPPGSPEPFDCKLQGKILQDFPLDVCNACGIPFSVGSTNGIYTASGKSSGSFKWKEENSSYFGVVTTDSSQLTAEFDPIDGSIPQGDGMETPEQFLSRDIADNYRQTVDQVGWQRTLVTLSPVSTDVTEEQLKLPSCFKFDATLPSRSLPTFI